MSLDKPFRMTTVVCPAAELCLPSSKENWNGASAWEVARRRCASCLAVIPTGVPGHLTAETVTPTLEATASLTYERVSSIHSLRLLLRPTFHFPLLYRGLHCDPTNWV